MSHKPEPLDTRDAGFMAKLADLLTEELNSHTDPAKLAR